MNIICPFKIAVSGYGTIVVNINGLSGVNILCPDVTACGSVGLSALDF